MCCFCCFSDGVGGQGRGWGGAGQGRDGLGHMSI